MYIYCICVCVYLCRLILMGGQKYKIYKLTNGYLSEKC